MGASRLLTRCHKIKIMNSTKEIREFIEAKVSHIRRKEEQADTSEHLKSATAFSVETLAKKLAARDAANELTAWIEGVMEGVVDPAYMMEELQKYADLAVVFHHKVTTMAAKSGGFQNTVERLSALYVKDALALYRTRRMTDALRLVSKGG